MPWYASILFELIGKVSDVNVVHNIGVSLHLANALPQSVTRLLRYVSTIRTLHLALRNIGKCINVESFDLQKCDELAITYLKLKSGGLYIVENVRLRDIKESRFPAPACGGRRLHSTACNGRSTPLVPLASLHSPNRGRRVACGSMKFSKYFDGIKMDYDIVCLNRDNLPLGTNSLIVIRKQ